jgi:hypothetical protein
LIRNYIPVIEKLEDIIAALHSLGKPPFFKLGDDFLFFKLVHFLCSEITVNDAFKHIAIYVTSFLLQYLTLRGMKEIIQKDGIPPPKSYYEDLVRIESLHHCLSLHYLA